MAEWSEVALFSWRMSGCRFKSRRGYFHFFFFHRFFRFLPFGFLLFILTSDPVSFASFLRKLISSKTINWSANSFQINHVTSMSWHMSPRYGHVKLVSGYPVSTAVSWPYCECDLLRHAWDTPPLLLIVSLTPPIQSVDEYVRTYARSITWQPKEKRLTIFYEYGVPVSNPDRQGA